MSQEKKLYLLKKNSKGQLIYPNKYLFEFLNSSEHSFSIHCANIDVFEKVVTLLKIFNLSSAVDYIWLKLSQK